MFKTKAEKLAWQQGFLNKVAAEYLTPEALRGAALGAPIGAGLSGLYGFLKPSPSKSRGDVSDPRLLRALRYALLGGALGGVGGGVAGHMAPEDIEQLQALVQSVAPNSEA